MADFFTQLTAVLTREVRRHPGRAGNSETRAELEQFSAPIPRTESAPEPQPVSQRTFAPVLPPRETTVQKPLSTVSAENWQSLEEIAAAVHDCRNCILAQRRLNTVPGEGNPHARLMFIGEGPGADEDRQGRPFVGAAGQLLDKMISAMQFSREEVYIANVVKCRPPMNRKPMPDEAAACIGYLKRQIELVNPEVIVLLGATAANFLLERPEGIMRLRGRWLEYNKIPVMPTFHPAYLLRQVEAKRDAWEDLKQVMRRLGKEPPQPVRRQAQ